MTSPAIARAPRENHGQREHLLEPVSVTLYVGALAGTIATQIALISLRITAVSSARPETIVRLGEDLDRLTSLAAVIFMVFLLASAWLVWQVWARLGMRLRFTYALVVPALLGAAFYLSLGVDVAGATIWYATLALTSLVFPVYVRILGRGTGWMLDARWALVLFTVGTLTMAVLVLVAPPGVAVVLLPLLLTLADHPALRDETTGAE
jgi:hypothetical protein